MPCLVESVLHRDPVIRNQALLRAYGAWTAAPTSEHRRLIRVIARIGILDPTVKHQAIAKSCLSLVARPADRKALRICAHVEATSIPIEPREPESLTLPPLFRLVSGRFGGEELSPAMDAWITKPSRQNRQTVRILSRFLATHAYDVWRTEAVEALEFVGTRDDLAAVFAVRNDRSMCVRASVASTMAGLGKSQYTGRIQAMADDPDPVVRRYAYCALAEANPALAIVWLSERRKVEKDDLALVGLFGALATLGDATAIAPLMAYATTRHRWLCSPARDCLENQGLPLPPDPFDTPEEDVD